MSTVRHNVRRYRMVLMDPNTGHELCSTMCCPSPNEGPCTACRLADPWPDWCIQYLRVRSASKRVLMPTVLPLNVPSLGASYVHCSGPACGPCNVLSCWLMVVLVSQCCSGILVLGGAGGCAGACHAGSLVPLWCCIQVHWWRSAACGLCNCVAALSLLILSTLCWAMLGTSVLGYLLSGTCMALDALTMVLVAVHCVPCHSACALQCACVGHVILALSSALLMAYHLVCVHGASHSHWYGASATGPLCMGMLSTVLCDVAHTGILVLGTACGAALLVTSTSASGSAALPLCWLLGLCAAVAALPTQPLLLPVLLCPPSHSLAYLLLWL